MRVKIVSMDHPHRGEYGRLTDARVRLETGVEMALVTLEHCPHGTDGCYVLPFDIRAVDEDPVVTGGIDA